MENDGLGRKIQVLREENVANREDIESLTSQLTVKVVFISLNFFSSFKTMIVYILSAKFTNQKNVPCNMFLCIA